MRRFILCVVFLATFVALDYPLTLYESEIRGYGFAALFAMATLCLFREWCSRPRPAH